MSDQQILGVAIGLLSLIFSEVPFLSLVYTIAILNVADWGQFNLLSGAYVIALLGSSLWRKVK